MPFGSQWRNAWVQLGDKCTGMVVKVKVSPSRGGQWRILLVLCFTEEMHACNDSRKVQVWVQWRLAEKCVPAVRQCSGEQSSFSALVKWKPVEKCIGALGVSKKVCQDSFLTYHKL